MVVWAAMALKRYRIYQLFFVFDIFLKKKIMCSNIVSIKKKISKNTILASEKKLSHHNLVKVIERTTLFLFMFTDSRE